VKIGITGRLIASHAAVALLAMVVFTGVIIGTTTRQARQTGMDVDRATALRLAPWIEEYYRTERSLDDLGAMASPHRGMQPPRTQMPMMGGGRRGAPFPTQLLEQPILIVDSRGEVLLRRGPTETTDIDPADGVPIRIFPDRETFLFVGGMISSEHNPLSAIFFRSTARAAAVTGVAILLSVVAMSIYWVRWLLRPIGELDRASRAIASGDYSGRAAVPRGTHELARLVLRFNAMADEVESQEHSRRRFIGDAAHELRTPISLLSTRLELLRDGIYTPDETQWNALKHDVGRLARLVDELQTLARADAGKLTLHIQPWRVSEAIETVCSHMMPAADERGGAIRSLLPDGAGDASLLVDPERFLQIMANLIGNALGYTDTGQEVILEVRLVGTPERPALEIAVEDQGPGIPEEDRARVFQRFVRLDNDRNRSRGGSGLGLAITTELVRMHHGTIHVEDSRHGNTGARFVVTLPGTHEPPEETVTPDGAAGGDVSTSGVQL
jgi:signal transduction histidine kinase